MMMEERYVEESGLWNVLRDMEALRHNLKLTLVEECKLRELTVDLEEGIEHLLNILSDYEGVVTEKEELEKEYSILEADRDTLFTQLEEFESETLKEKDEVINELTEEKEKLENTIELQEVRIEELKQDFKEVEKMLEDRNNSIFKLNAKIAEFDRFMMLSEEW